MNEEIKAYCITLSPDKIGKTIEKISNLGFSKVKIVKGVEGNLLKDEELKKVLTPRAFYELKSGRYVHEALSGLGSVGCFLSHKLCWSKCYRKKRTIAIFEDDFTYESERASSYLKKIYSEALSQKYDILRLVAFGDTYQEKVSETLNRIKNPHCAAGYLITPKAAKHLLNLSSRIDSHVDYFMNFVGNFKNLNHYTCNEKIFFCNDRESTLNHNKLKSCSETSTSFDVLSIILILVFLIMFIFSYSFLIVSNIH